MGNSELGSNKTCCLSIGRSLRGSCSCCIDRSIRLAEVATSTQSCHCCRQAWSHSFERLKLMLYLLVTFTLMNDPVALSVKEKCARDEDGTVYITSGGAGNNFIVGWDTKHFAGHKDAPEWSVFRTVNHGVSELRANSTLLELIYVDLKRGEVHDRLVAQVSRTK